MQTFLHRSPRQSLKTNILVWLGLVWTVTSVYADVVTLSPEAERINLRRYLQVLEDRTGELAFEDILREDSAFSLQPDGETDLNFGYSRSAWWLKIMVNTRGQDPVHERLLEISFPTLDSVTVLVQNESGVWDRYTTGDKLPYSTRAFAHRNFVFPLTLPPGRLMPVYLRVSSEGSLTIPLTLWSRTAFHQHSQDAYVWFSLYYGMLLALGLYNFLLYVSLRDRTFLAYVAFVGCMAIGQLSLNGMGNQYLWPAWPGWGNAAFNSGFAAAGLFGAVFTRLFLATRRTTPRLDRLTLLLVNGFAIAALAPAVISYQWAAILTSVLGVLFSLIAVIAAVLCLRRGHPGARWFLLAWTMLLIGVAVMGLRNLGWIPTTPITTYAMQIGSALEILLLSFALADRFQIARKEMEAAQRDALASKELMLKNLRESEQLLEARVGARTRELVDANIKLLENQERLTHLANHDQLTGLANRRLLDEYFKHSLALARRHKWNVAVLLIDLDGFKQVNDTHGHAIGDELLVGFAMRLLEQTRESDTVARLGGDEFVVVLEQIRDKAEVREKTVSIATLLSEPYMTSAGPMQIGTSIGIAFFPEDGETSQVLLRQADQSMYRAKTSNSSVEQPRA